MSYTDLKTLHLIGVVLFLGNIIVTPVLEDRRGPHRRAPHRRLRAADSQLGRHRLHR